MIKSSKFLAKIQEVAADVRNGRVRNVNVRTILNWNDARSRGKNIVEEIRQTLYSFGLITVPDINSRKLLLDSRVSFRLLLDEPRQLAATAGQAKNVSNYESGQRQKSDRHEMDKSSFDDDTDNMAADSTTTIRIVEGFRFHICQIDAKSSDVIAIFPASFLIVAEPS